MKIQRTLQCALSRATFVVVIFVVVCCLVVLVCTSLCDKQAHVLLAAAAFVASITAIFGLSVRDWVWRPVLKVNYVHGPDYCEAAVLRGEVK